jgi:Sulfotransferase family
MKRYVNAALLRTTGYQLQKPASQRRIRMRLRPGDRLLEAPVFVMCTVRSGSTLLRVLLDSHSQIHSPHEMHLKDIDVSIRDGYPQKALREVGLDEERLRFLLWDRVLHRELQESGKRWLVNKTPSDVFIVDRILQCWPDARFIFLLRHPAAIARSRKALRPQADDEQNIDVTLRYCEALERARQTYEGPTVRYEELAANPEPTMRRLCAFLGVPWEAAMLDYGRFQHGPYRAGLGDWADKIRTGEVQPPDPPPSPEEIPERLRAMCATWGYLPGGDAAPPPAATAAADL